MPYILALDQGTTSSRAIVFDHDGAIQAVAQKEFTQIFPAGRLGRARPAGDLGVADRRRRRSARPRRTARRSDIAAIGITNQRETTIVWDRETGEPVHNAIVWQDRRTADFCERLKADGAGATVQAEDRPAHRRVLLRQQDPLDSRQRAGRARARRRRQAGVRHRRHLAGLEADRRHAARHRRQQRVADDAVQHPHAASGTTSCCGCSASRRACCPRCASSSEVYGNVVDVARHRAACRSPASPAISRRRSSARCAAQPGMSKNTYGTGCFLLQNIGTTPTRVAAISWSRPSRGRSASAPNTRSKAASSSAARSCSGSATASA